MKVDIHYVSDGEGKTQAVQLSLPDWKKIVTKLRRYEQQLEMKSDLTAALKEIDAPHKTQKQTLSDFLNEL